MTGRIVVIGSNGHTLVEWDTEVESAVKQAEEVFLEALMDGRAIFASGPTLTAPPTQVREFDPQVKEYTVLNPLVGG